MRVLFLTRYPVEGASSRYRVYQYVPTLEAEGIECTISPFMGRQLFQLMSQRGQSVKKAIFTLLASARRLSWIVRTRRFDVVVFQRECLPFNTTVMERWISRRKPTIFDYDDALFIRKVNEATPMGARLRDQSKYLRIFGLVDLVLAGNAWLADAAREEGARAEAFHVAEDADRLGSGNRDRDPGGPVTLGWFGSGTTEKYLEFIREPLERLARSHAVRLHIVGGGRFTSDVIEVVHSSWSLDAEPELLASFDVGLMPLPLEEWSKGKSGGKARTYMAAGVPPVVTGIGYNLELLEDGNTGRLVKTSEEWYDALAALCDDGAERGRMGQAAQAYVREHFDPTKQGQRLAQLLREVQGNAR